MRRIWSAGINALAVGVAGLAIVMTDGTPAKAEIYDCKENNGSIYLQRIKPDSTMCPGDVGYSSSGMIGLVQQGDGNLVLYTLAKKFRSDTAVSVLWATGRRTPGNRAYLDEDGHLENHAPDGFMTQFYAWESNPDAWVKIQDDGKLVMYTKNDVPLYQTCRGYKWCRA